MSIANTKRFGSLLNSLALQQLRGHPKVLDILNPVGLFFNYYFYLTHPHHRWVKETTF